MTRIVCLNGEFVPEDEARIPIMDRGLLFADAIYEGMGVLDGGIVDAFAGPLQRSGFPNRTPRRSFSGSSWNWCDATTSTRASCTST